MKLTSVLMVVLAAMAPALAQTQPSASHADTPSAAKATTPKYRLADCQRLAATFHGLKRSEQELALWCVAHDQSSSRRGAVAPMLWDGGLVLGWAEGYAEAKAREDKPSGALAECIPVHQFYDSTFSETDAKRLSAVAGKVFDQFWRFDKEKVERLSSAAFNCVFDSANRKERGEAVYALQDTKIIMGFRTG
jgi:hypothetical protein